jgi:hypothetical protein
MSTFGSLLVQDQIVDVVEIEHALQRQVIYGGDLATNLLELRLVDETVLTEYAARSFGLPVLGRELLNNPDIDAIKAVPWYLVDAYRILPVKIEEHRILLAVSSPVVSRALQEISHVVGLDPHPHFALDFRLDMSLNRIWGIPTTPRLKALRERFAPEFRPDQPPLIPRPRASNVEIDSKTVSSDEDTARIYTLSRPQEPISDRLASEITLLKVPRKITGDGNEIPMGRTADAPSARSREPRPKSEEQVISRKSPLKETPRMTPVGDLSKSERPVVVLPDLEEVRNRLSGVENRDAVIETVIDYLAQVFEFVALFIVKKGIAKARAAVLRNKRISSLSEMEISLDQEGIFKTVYETKSFHLGPLATTEREQELLEKIGRPWPKSCAIFPITLRRRVVLMVYGDSGDLGVQVDQGYELVRFSNIASEALERMLLKKKRGTDGRVPSSGPIEQLRRALSSAPPPEPVEAPSSDSDSRRTEQREDLSNWAGRYHLKGENKDAKGSGVAVDRVLGVAKGRISAIPRPHSDTAPGSGPSNRGLLGKEPVKDSPQKGELGQKHSLQKTQEHSPLMDRIDEESLESHSASDPSDGPLDNVRGTADYGKSPLMLKDVVSPVSQPETATSVVSAGATRQTRSVVVDMKEEVERLVQRILAPGRFDETAADLLLGIGDDALRKLVEKFPGPLTSDRYQKAGRLRRVEQHGPLIRTLLKFGQKAVPHLLPLFDSRDSDVRFYATFMFSELKYPEALGRLTTRLFDADRQIRAIATDIVKGFAQYPEYRWAMGDIVAVLTSSTSSLDAKRIGSESLGELGERAAVPALTDLLDSADGQLKELSRQSLVKIAFDDLGYSSQRWKSWWEKHKEQHRIEWAIASITHPKEHIRNAAKKELKQMVGEVVEGFNRPMDHNQRLDFQKQSMKWWKQEGQALYPLWEGYLGDGNRSSD